MTNAECKECKDIEILQNEIRGIKIYCFDMLMLAIEKPENCESFYMEREETVFQQITEALAKIDKLQSDFLKKYPTTV